LQLVGSLLGVALAESVVEDGIEDLLLENEETIRSLTATEPWVRPGKTQTKTQWQYIARVALGVVDALGVDRAAVDLALRERYGFSPINTLTVNAHWPA
jgi:hypothetical protein